MACRCAFDADVLCQWCKKVIHRCREVGVPYGGKSYHLACWQTFRRWVADMGDHL